MTFTEFERRRSAGESRKSLPLPTEWRSDRSCEVHMGIGWFHNSASPESESSNGRVGSAEVETAGSEERLFEKENSDVQEESGRSSTE